MRQKAAALGVKEDDLNISKRDMEKYQRERKMSCFDERKMEIPNFSTKNKTKKQSEIKGRKIEKY